MRTLSPGKFEVTIGGEAREILVSLGLKTEIYKLITNAQLKIANLSKRVFLDEETSAKIQEKDAKVKELEAAEAAEEEIEAVRRELDDLYNEALSELETRQATAFEESMQQRIDVSENIFVEAIQCLLAERDETGKILSKPEKEVILWSPEYAEAQEELTDLLHAVTEYITSALKKISGINKMVNETSESANQETMN